MGRSREEAPDLEERPARVKKKKLRRPQRRGRLNNLFFSSSLPLSTGGIPTRLRPPRSRVSAASPGGGGAGGGIAERPALRPSLTPSKVGDKARSSPYRVMLHNDDVNKREYVVSVLMKVVEGLTVDDAVNVMNVSFWRACGRAKRGERFFSPPLTNTHTTPFHLFCYARRRPTRTAPPPSSYAASPMRNGIARACEATAWSRPSSRRAAGRVRVGGATQHELMGRGFWSSAFPFFFLVGRQWRGGGESG